MFGEGIVSTAGTFSFNASIYLALVLAAGSRRAYGHVTSDV